MSKISSETVFIDTKVYMNSDMNEVGHDKYSRSWWRICVANINKYVLTKEIYFFVRHCQNLRVFSCVNGF
jgi:hypothetical protein